MRKNKIKILMAAAEVFPFAKVGGLADVVGSLPPALSKLRVDVRVIMPLYGFINRRKLGLKGKVRSVKVIFGPKEREVSVWEGNLPNSRVPVYFLDVPFYFGGKKIYTKKKNAERFLFFSAAVLRALPEIEFRPDIIHCHDFHTALIPDLLKARPQEFFKKTKTLLTIHNFNYQGISGLPTLKIGDLNADSLPSLKKDAEDGNIDFLAQGIINADLVNTVSPTYAKEIATSLYGAHLEKIVRQYKSKIFGIVNGIDINFFDPEKDKFIKYNYSEYNLNEKIKNKKFLQKKLGLEINGDKPLAGIVSRLAWQKGIDLLTSKFHELDCQFIILGTGEKRYEKYLRALARKYPRQFSVRIKFDQALASQIYAGADLFLMPSRFEPCGLGQMIAMRYGAVPVVRQTGGLVDTVSAQTGFNFKDVSTEAFYKTLKKALRVYKKNPLVWRKLQKNGMRQDFSWDESAKQYLKLYKKLSAPRR